MTNKLTKDRYIINFLNQKENIKIVLNHLLLIKLNI